MDIVVVVQGQSNLLEIVRALEPATSGVCWIVLPTEAHAQQVVPAASWR